MTDSVEHRLRVLEAKEAIRACIGRYFDLCDVPGAFSDVSQLTALFTANATWRGVGEAYAGKFGEVTGRDEVAAHVAGYLPPSDHFRGNTHLLGSEQLATDGETGRGQWLMQQLSHYADDSRDLLCARITVDFVLDPDPARCHARISAFQTERLFRSALPTST